MVAFVAKGSDHDADVGAVEGKPAAGFEFQNQLAVLPFSNLDDRFPSRPAVAESKTLHDNLLRCLPATVALLGDKPIHFVERDRVIAFAAPALPFCRLTSSVGQCTPVTLCVGSQQRSPAISQSSDTID